MFEDFYNTRPTTLVFRVATLARIESSATQPNILRSAHVRLAGLLYRSIA